MNETTKMTRSELLAEAAQKFPSIEREDWAARGITNTVIRKALDSGVLPPSLAGTSTAVVPVAAQTLPSSVKDAITTLTEALGTGPASEEQIREQVRVVMKEITPVSIIKIEHPSGEQIQVEGQHVMFPALMDLVILREEALLTGPPGVGKSYAAKAAATAAGLAYGELSVGPTTTESKLLGYQDANGNYVRTEFRDRYENGGVFLLDETDNGSGAVLAVLNNALSTGRLAFPDGVIDRHADFTLIATANTVGHGATREFMGRQPLDAAFRDRFVIIDWPVDEVLENNIAMAKAEALGLSEPKARAWIDNVRKVRKGIDKSGQIKVLATPRATFKGIALLARGWDQTTVEDAVIWKGSPSEVKRKVLGA